MCHTTRSFLAVLFLPLLFTTFNLNAQVDKKKIILPKLQTTVGQNIPLENLKIKSSIPVVIEQRPLLKGEKKIVFSFPDRTRASINSVGMSVEVLYGDRNFLGNGGGSTKVIEAQPTNWANSFEAILPQVDSSNTFKFEPGETVYFSVRLTSSDAQKVEHTETNSFVMPAPIIVGIMGDSFAAGEGAPERKSSNWRNVQWSDGRYSDSHNSTKSGARVGCNEFAQAHPELWVVCKSWAITGATIQDQSDELEISGGLTSDYQADRELVHALSEKKETQVDGQLVRAANWLDSRGYENVDVLVFSLGGNDAGFGKIIKWSILWSDDYDDWVDYVDSGLSITSERIPLIDFAIQEAVNPTNMFWLNYPDLTRNEFGTFSQLPEQGSSFDSSFRERIARNGVSVTELRGASRILRNHINPKIAEWCGQISYCSLLDVQERAFRNGIGNSNDRDRWFNTFFDSQYRVQGSWDGSVHPNEKGHKEIYTPLIRDAIEDLYSPQSGSFYANIRAERESARNERRAERAAQLREDIERRFGEIATQSGRTNIGKLQREIKLKADKIDRRTYAKLLARKKALPPLELFDEKGRMFVSKKAYKELIQEYKDKPGLLKKIQSQIVVLKDR